MPALFHSFMNPIRALYEPLPTLYGPYTDPYRPYTGRIRPVPTLYGPYTGRIRTVTDPIRALTDPIRTLYGPSTDSYRPNTEFMLKFGGPQGLPTRSRLNVFGGENGYLLWSITNGNVGCKKVNLNRNRRGFFWSASRRLQ